MTYRQLAINNIKGSWHRYGAYFLSCVFAVMIFFVYASIIYHPEVADGKIQESDYVRQLMIICEVLIMVFSFFFILYSSSAFLKSRQKELGLLSLFGSTKGQLRMLVFYENMLISILAIVVGIGSGMVLLKLFLMAMSRLLQVDAPLSFYISPSAIGLTSIGYLLLFAFITLFSLRHVSRVEIIHLIRADKEPKSPPKFSWFLVLLSVLTLGSGYGLAFVTDLKLFILSAMPIIGLTVLGTYFLFTQLSVAVIRALQKNKRFYYRGTNLLNVSQAAFKMRDNARVLFNVSILCAVVLTATATVYAFDQGMRISVRLNNPFVLTMSAGKADRPPVTPDRIERLAEQMKHHVTFSDKASVVDAMVKGSRLEQYGTLVGESDYNRLAGELGYDPVRIEEGKAILIDQRHMLFYEDLSQDMQEGDRLSVQVEGQKKPFQLQIQQVHTQQIVLTRSIGYRLFVVPDALLDPLYRQAPADQAQTLYVMNWTDWEDAMPLMEQIREMRDPASDFGMYSRTEDWNDIRQNSSLGLFIGLFISLLFFIASGSVIYFKLFTELQDDQAHFRALTRIGLSVTEIRRVVTFQVGLIFYAPCIVGSIHTLFAMKTLTNLMNINVMGYGVTVVGLFVLMQTLYFLMARRTYMGKILEEAVV
ncbi:FtsX-like permease family protein [Paenibacillus thiaminolyticus]|uniref:FtsX-like permease family protein n=1 Tax=Paenibacillus thiaminolyticus TaxID=49283 RepID=UPI0035A6FA9A